MFLKFTHMELEGFQSFGPLTKIDFESQGFVAIKGVNEYEKQALSNGSGKTSTLEALDWCLFGKTSAGLSNVKNRYYDKGCYVMVSFQKDNQVYSILRSQDHHLYKTTVILKKHNSDGSTEDLSCRNRSDTDKLIKTEILPFSQDIFLSTIFLSQGFSGRLSLLSPSARKERLEILANIDEAVNQFKDKVSQKKSEYQDKLNQINQEISYLNGQLNVYTSEKDEIDKLKGESVDTVPEIPIETLRTKLDNMEPKIKEISDQISSVIISLNKKATEYNANKKNLSSIKANWEKVCYKLNDLHVTSECPTCHQIITGDVSKDIEKEFTDTANSYESEIKSIKDQMKLQEKEYSENAALKSSLETKKETLTNLYNKTRNTILDYEKVTTKNSELVAKLNRLEECINRIAELSSEISSKALEQSKVEITYQVADHSLKLITKDFRAYLLSDMVNKMNLKLEEYSEKLFSNDTEKIYLTTDTSKLDIMLGDSTYESLSGGEKKKVDLALVLAQRDVSLSISGFSCNILVLDEILENMDEQASNVSLMLLNEVAESIESVFLISHNNYSIPVDRTITVTKQPNRISTLSIA